MNLISISTAKRTKTVSVWLALATLLALLTGVFSVHPAHAAEDCVPDSETACVEGVIKTSDKEPAAGVELTLNGPSGEASTISGEDGRWSFSVTVPGSYEVTLNVDTLPDGQFISQTDVRELEIDLGKKGAALFPLTSDESAAAEPGGEVVSTSKGSNQFSWPRFWQQFVSGLRMGLLIALASVGLSLVFGTTGISNFSQGEMVSFGGLLAATFMTLTGNLIVAGILAIFAAALFGYFQDVLMWKPLRKRGLSLMQLMIVSIGLSIFMQFTFQFFYGGGVVSVGAPRPETVEFWGITLTTYSVFAMIVSIVAIGAVGYALMYTRFGRATRAISDNPPLAKASGINVDKVIRIVWIVGSGLAGLAGVFFALIFNGITWFTGGQMLLLFFAAVTLGGLGTAFGAFVGSMIIGLVVEMTNIWLPGDLKFATALFILILILLVRPQGLFGRKERIG